MEWVQGSNNQSWELEAYGGAVTVAAIIVDSDGDYWLNAGSGMVTDELLDADNLADAQAEALERLENALSGEIDYYNELLSSVRKLAAK